MDRVDVAVVGGGPVGLATAIHARLAGLRVCVLERRAVPPDKACGEGLMPAGVAALQHMGVALSPQERHPLRGICYLDGPWRAQGDFAHGEVGWGVRRLALNGALLARARALAAQVHLGCNVQGCDIGDDSVLLRTAQGEVQARWLVGADGLHSKVRAWAGLPAATQASPVGALHGQMRAWAGLPAVPPSRRRFGVRRHFALAPWGNQVEVHWQRGVEAYVTPVAANQVNIALLWEGGPATFFELLQAFPALHDRVRDAPCSSSARGSGPFAQHLARRVGQRVALVGDAAGYLDALTGEGLTLGFRSSAALARVLAQDLPLSQYETAYRRLSANYYRTTAALLGVARRPWLRRALIVALAQVPGAFDRVLAWHGQSSAPDSARLIPASPTGN